MKCLVTTSVDLTLAPQGQQSCLLIKNSTGHPLATVIIEIRQLSFRCDKRVLYYTRSYRIETISSKRCPTAGSCSGDTCKLLRHNDSIAEFTYDINKKPGYSFCAASCACAGCGCFYCTSGCLFYRFFATPLTDTVYEVFDCATFSPQMELTLKVVTAVNTTVHIIRLAPGHKMFSSALNISFSLKSFSVPPAPVLTRPFITDGQRTIAKEVAPPGQPIPGMIGSLQCETRDIAKHFDKCYFPPSSCACQERTDRAACTCTPVDLLQVFNEHKNYLLPLQTPALVIYPDYRDNQKSIYAAFTQHAVMQTNLEFSNYQVNFKVYRTRCEVKFISLTGCFECITQAKLTVSCQTDGKPTMAVLDCSDSITSIPCNASLTKTTLSVSFSAQNIERTCNVSCGGFQSSLNIKGTLMRSPIKKILQVETTFGDLAQTLTREDGDPPFSAFSVDNPFTVLSEIFSSTWMGQIILILALIGLVVLVILIAPLCVSCFTSIRSTFATQSNGYTPLRTQEETEVVMKDLGHSSAAGGEEPIRPFSPAFKSHTKRRKKRRTRSPTARVSWGGVDQHQI
jgi:hypothetical protein